VRLIQHSARLDLAFFEDEALCDKLDRARWQGWDRAVMIEQVGRIVQLVVAALALGAGLLLVAPVMTLVLVVRVVASVLGESHIAFLLWSLNFRQTPLRRRLVNITQLGTFRASAKEVKLFDLSAFLTRQADQISAQMFREELSVHRHKLRLT